MELTDILDPYMFDNHRYIVDALYKVYEDLGDQYVKEKYKPSKQILEDA